MRRVYPLRTRVLLSGGMDSAVCLAWALKHLGGLDNTVDAMGFDYGQAHAENELHAAKNIAASLGVPFVIYDIRDGVQPLGWRPHGPLVRRVMDCSLDCESHFHPVTLTGDDETLTGSDAVVEGRNRALIYSASWVHEERNYPDRIVFGACADDQEHFEDCRPEFFLKLADELNLPIYTPLIHRTKKEIVRLAHELGASNLVNMSWSCYRAGNTQCGECGACKARARGFA
jgi:7-cyano-7-deazaguanine synthase